MTKHIFVKDLRVGDNIPDFVAGVSSLKFAQDRNGNDYANLTLMDSSGSLSGKVWSEALQKTPAKLNLGNVYEFSISAQEYKGAMQLNISSFNELKDDEYELADIVKSSPFSVEVLDKGVSKYIGQIEDGFFSELVSNFYQEHKERYLAVPAASQNHHEFRGGLATHVLEMYACAEAVLRFYPDADKSLVYTGIFFHDIGKFDELKVDGFVTEYTRNGNLIGHISQGVLIVDRYARKFVEGSDKSVAGKSATVAEQVQAKLDILYHIILSHHGRKEFGSPVEPMTVEAMVVSFIDDLSAQVRRANNIVSSGGSATSTDEFVKSWQDKFFTGTAKVMASGQKVESASAPDTQLDPDQHAVQSKVQPTAEDKPQSPLGI